MNSAAIILVATLAFGGMLGSGCDRQNAPPDADSYGTLTALADKYGSDKGTKFHNFTEIYEYFFLPVRESATKVFEIGVFEGASMQMLRDYFPNATIYGADIYDTSALDSPRLKTIVVDQAKRDELRKLIDAHGSDYDIIIDDGGHTMEQQQVSFGYLFPHVAPGGYYIIEDVHTSLLGDEYGARQDARNTTLSMFYTYIADAKIVSEYMSDEETAYATDNIDSCNFYVHAGQSHSLAWIIKKKATSQR